MGSPAELSRLPFAPGRLARRELAHGSSHQAEHYRSLVRSLAPSPVCGVVAALARSLRKSRSRKRDRPSFIRCSGFGPPTIPRPIPESPSPPPRPTQAQVSSRRSRARRKSACRTPICRTRRSRDNPLIINVPMAISAQTVNYNIPDLNGRNLKLDGPTLAGIYSGKIRSWDDPAIAAMNTGVNLPHNAIAPIHRSDVSGDTFIFTQYRRSPRRRGSTARVTAPPLRGPLRRSLNCRRQFRHDRQDPGHALFDWLRRRQLSMTMSPKPELGPRRSRAMTGNSCCRRLRRSRPPPPRSAAHPARRAPDAGQRSRRQRLSVDQL